MANGIPEDLIEKLGRFDQNLTKLEELFNEIEVGVNKHYERSAHDMALVDTMTMFLLDSLMWTINGIRGENATKNEELRIDLARTQRIVGEMREVNSRLDAPRINHQAAKNFVRNALWEAPETSGKSNKEK